MITNRSAWRKERLVYTPKLVIFASANGTEVIDIVPIVEITGVRSNEDSPPRQTPSAKDLLLGDDVSDPGMDAAAATPTNKAEATIQTEAGGYNSGRTYRVRAGTARDTTLLAEDLSKLSSAARAKLLRKSWLRGMQVPSPRPPWSLVSSRRPVAKISSALPPPLGHNDKPPFTQSRPALQRCPAASCPPPSAGARLNLEID